MTYTLNEERDGLFLTGCHSTCGPARVRGPKQQIRARRPRRPGRSTPPVVARPGRIVLAPLHAGTRCIPPISASGHEQSSDPSQPTACDPQGGVIELRPLRRGAGRIKTACWPAAALPLDARDGLQGAAGANSSYDLACGARCGATKATGASNTRFSGMVAALRWRLSRPAIRASSRFRALIAPATRRNGSVSYRATSPSGRGVHRDSLNLYAAVGRLRNKTFNDSRTAQRRHRPESDANATSRRDSAQEQFADWR